MSCLICNQKWCIFRNASAMSKRKIDARLNNEEKNMKRRKMGLVIKVKNEKREAVAVIVHVKSDPMSKLYYTLHTYSMEERSPSPSPIHGKFEKKIMRENQGNFDKCKKIYPDDEKYHKNHPPGPVFCSVLSLLDMYGNLLHITFFYFRKDHKSSRHRDDERRQ